MIRKTLYHFALEILRTRPRPSIRLIKSIQGDKELVGVEIGTYEGVNAKSILKTLNIKRMFCIDPYTDDFSKKETPPFSSFSQSAILAERRLRKYKQVTIVKDFSQNVFKQIPEELDFVYIDGAHDYESVKNDINLYYPKIKKGGVLAGHDFYNGFCTDHDGIIKAVTEFTVKNNLKLFVHHPDWWVIV